jgi:hypothetical protein
VGDVVVGESEDERTAQRDNTEEGKVGGDLETKDGVEQICEMEKMKTRKNEHNITRIGGGLDLPRATGH